MTSMEAHMMKKMTALGALAVAVVLGEMASAQSANSIDGTITVTPVASVMLQLSPTFYAFGSVDINTSTNSTSALVLTSTGTVGVTMQKKVLTEPSGWAAGSAAGINTYVLHAIAQTTVPGASVSLDASTKFDASNALSNLTDNAAAAISLTATGTVNLWYRLVMPTKTTSQATKTITLRYTGTAQ